mmetsp:Transcript_5142/g.15024  ORF Transcript_5142/g.15024 Transcript_5142/m.15024 type:complete len:538 (-) Transcript_5142:164-1777(-)
MEGESKAHPGFNVVSAIDLLESREIDMLASIDRLRNASGGVLEVGGLVTAFQTLDICDGLEGAQVEMVVHKTAAKLGHTMSTPVEHDSCVVYYNFLVEYVNSYEARLADPKRNCTPQYALAGLDMPACFWVNLDRARDRAANMHRLLKGYRHTRVSALDAQGEEWMEVCQEYGLDRALKATAAERCCTMSHVRAFEAIQDAGVDVAVVLEDDVTFKFIPPSFSFLKTVAALPSDWDVLHISARSNPPSKLLNIPYQFCEWRPKLCYSTAAFMINGKHIDSIIDKVKRALREGTEARADWVIYGSCKTYVLCRPIMDEDPFHFASAIHSENEEYHRRMHVALSELYCNEVRQDLGLPLLPLTYSKGFKSSDLKDTAKVAQSPMPSKPRALADFRAERLAREAARRATEEAASTAADLAEATDAEVAAGLGVLTPGVHGATPLGAGAGAQGRHVEQPPQVLGERGEAEIAPPPRRQDSSSAQSESEPDTTAASTLYQAGGVSRTWSKDAASAASTLDAHTAEHVEDADGATKGLSHTIL